MGHAKELLSIMKAFGLGGDDEVAQAERLVLDGELTTNMLRSKFKPQLSSLTKEEVNAWKYHQWVEGSKARMKAAVSARDELVVRRSRAFDEAIGKCSPS